ncbi:hypothetical protein DPX16_22119 [Anabarilius grahami]|uniref:Uncharacterized protein n=1 Tax=Anabarilius grahami TaxID=495550 RepID=A0A3N0XNC4_ANAGA|nr:hypothetical protein DPX16_22119 [Anabarilius grahami]
MSTPPDPYTPQRGRDRTSNALEDPALTNDLDSNADHLYSFCGSLQSPFKTSLMVNDSCQSDMHVAAGPLRWLKMHSLHQLYKQLAACLDAFRLCLAYDDFHFSSLKAQKLKSNVTLDVLCVAGLSDNRDMIVSRITSVHSPQDNNTQGRNPVHLALTQHAVPGHGVSEHQTPLQT